MNTNRFHDILLTNLLSFFAIGRWYCFNEIRLPSEYAKFIIMADPFSIGAGTAGLIPLVIQLVDGCIKGYQLYTTAVDMPKEYTNLMTLFRWEQHHFLEFCKEAGLLYRDTGRSMPIEVDRLLREFAKKDEAYHKMTILTSLAI